MAEPRITLEQLRSLDLKSVVYAKQLPSPGKGVRIRTPNGQYYQVTKAAFTRRGNNVLIGDGNESVILTMRSTLSQFTRIAALGLITIAALSTLLELVIPRPSADVVQRINDLTAVQKSLQDVARYVDAEKSSLEHLSADVDKLQKEKDVLSRAVQLNRDQVQALLAAQAAEQQRTKWLSLGLSFILGVLSSVIADLLLGIWRRRQVVGPAS
jgi:hypothetical protein